MIRFPEIEALGVRVAAISDQGDGDCGRGALENRAALCARLGIDPSALCAVKQVHGSDIAIPQPGDTPTADGLTTDQRGVALAISVADCVPIFLVDNHCGAIGLVHAGREGTLLRVAKAAVAAMRKRYQCEARHIHALIGPSAGPERYEVSEAMAESWEHAGLPRHGRYLDLWEANRRQLHNAGVAIENIHVCGICTISDKRLYSYRRGDASARNLAVLMR